MHNRPAVLFIGGHDPTGGAGIQADIETAAAHGVHAMSLVTALTAQDTRDVATTWPTPVDALLRQFDVLLGDMSPAAVKLGLLGDGPQVDALAARLRNLRCPLVLDPVLAAGGGFDLDRGGLVAAVREHLLPLTTLVTPNRAEARRLSGLDDADDAASALLAAGTAAVLLTGADEAEGGQVRNRLFRADTATRDYDWPRLPHAYHGSGCTLASACAVRLAQGHPIDEAVAMAQQFTWRALQNAHAPGHGQWLPWRVQ
ncbi:MAG: hydroxymethylpyrimidine/phosphomethylpyrimidine kinase [Gammaproteobacteria bacterium]|nr:hydroxymethylpyrimidine/phosphomethylpyrimidine kinase [Gammaproteobacteria bacterium]